MHIRRSLRYIAIVAVLALPTFASTTFAGMPGGGDPAKPTPTDSMGPMKIPGIDIDNFGLVDGHIYRGKQPTPEEYRELKELGISTVIDLRNDPKSYAREAAEAAGLEYVNIPMDDHDKPYDDQIAAFLKIVTNPANGKVYVHCAGGRHRTGASIAIYRIAVQGWNADQAYREMKNYDFYTRWGHGGFKRYVFDYYERMKANPSAVPMCYAPGVKNAATAAVEALL